MDCDFFDSEVYSLSEIIKGTFDLVESCAIDL